MNGLALCAGAGGLELGIELVVPGYQTVCYVERDAYAAAALVARMEESALAPAPVWDDITTFDGEPWRGVVDLVSAGFPCQPFSSAGKQRGLADERWLWPDIERIVREVQPRRVFLENVPGLVHHGLWAVLGGLAELGYDAEWDLFSAEEVGASHGRQRFFLLAERRHVADADEHGCGVDWERAGVRDGGSQRRHDADGCGGAPIFPPGPSDLDLWVKVLAEAPEIEPSLCRVADGVAERMEYRTDRLRTLGNGVVPLQAAYAFRALAACLSDGLVV